MQYSNKNIIFVANYQSLRANCYHKIRLYHYATKNNRTQGRTENAAGLLWIQQTGIRSSLWKTTHRQDFPGEIILQRKITPSYLEHIIYRRELFRETTGTSKALHLTFVTTYGVARNAQYGMIQSEITMDDLFKQ